MSGDFVIVLTTWPADREAEAFARTLVEERLAACVSVLPPMESVYRWEGKVEQAAERQIIIKTMGTAVPALRERIAALHPYDVPEFVVLAITDGSGAYLGWIAESTNRLA